MQAVSPTKWALIEHEHERRPVWAEVYRRDAPQRWDKPNDAYAYLAVDSRISRGTHLLYANELHDTKPTWEPDAPVGTKIEVHIRRSFTADDRLTRTALSPMAAWHEFEMENMSGFRVESVIVDAIQGYDGTHRCSYCEARSAVNPSEHAPCAGCGRIAWKPWTDKVVPVLGPQPKVDNKGKLVEGR